MKLESGLFFHLKNEVNIRNISFINCSFYNIIVNDPYLIYIDLMIGGG